MVSSRLCTHHVAFECLWDHPEAVAFIVCLQFKVPETLRTVLQHKVSLGHDPKVVLNAVVYAMRASKRVLEEPYTGQQREVQSSPPGEEITPCHQYMLDADHLESTFGEKVWRSWWKS